MKKIKNVFDSFAMIKFVLSGTKKLYQRSFIFGNVQSGLQSGKVVNNFLCLYFWLLCDTNLWWFLIYLIFKLDMWKNYVNQKVPTNAIPIFSKTCLSKHGLEDQCAEQAAPHQACNPNEQSVEGRQPILLWAQEERKEQNHILIWLNIEKPIDKKAPKSIVNNQASLFSKGWMIILIMSINKYFLHKGRIFYEI